jgi:hypothetical protein
MRVPFDDKVWAGRSDDGEPGDTRRVFNQVVPFSDVVQVPRDAPQSRPDRRSACAQGVAPRFGGFAR